MPNAIIGNGINAHIKNERIKYLSLKVYLFRTIKDKRMIDGKK
jgi:hypothetical protein